MTTIAGSTLTASYAEVKNVNTDYTEVIVELSYATTKDQTTPGTYSGISATIGGLPVTPLSIEVVANPAPEEISVVADEFGWADELYKYGQGGLDIVVTVPRKKSGTQQVIWLSKTYTSFQHRLEMRPCGLKLFLTLM